MVLLNHKSWFWIDIQTPDFNTGQRTQGLCKRRDQPRGSCGDAVAQSVTLSWGHLLLPKFSVSQVNIHASASGLSLKNLSVGAVQTAARHQVIHTCSCLENAWRCFYSKLKKWMILKHTNYSLISLSSILPILYAVARATLSRSTSWLSVKKKLDFRRETELLTIYQIWYCPFYF